MHFKLLVFIMFSSDFVVRIGVKSDQSFLEAVKLFGQRYTIAEDCSYMLGDSDCYYWGGI